VLCLIEVTNANRVCRHTKGYRRADYYAPYLKDAYRKYIAYHHHWEDNQPYEFDLKIENGARPYYVSLERTDVKSLWWECHLPNGGCCRWWGSEHLDDSCIAKFYSSWSKYYRLWVDTKYIDVNKAVLIVLVNTPEGNVYYFQPLTHNVKSCSEIAYRPIKLHYEIDGGFVKDSSGNILYTYIPGHKATQVYHKDEILSSPFKMLRQGTLYIEFKIFLPRGFEMQAYFFTKNSEKECNPPSYLNLRNIYEAIGFTEGVQMIWRYWDYLKIAYITCRINQPGILLVYTTTTQNMDTVRDYLRHQIFILYDRINEKEFDIYLDEDLDTDYRLFAVNWKEKIYHDISETISLPVPTGTTCQPAMKPTQQHADLSVLNIQTFVDLHVGSAQTKTAPYYQCTRESDGKIYQHYYRIIVLPTFKSVQINITILPSETDNYFYDVFGSPVVRKALRIIVNCNFALVHSIIHNPDISFTYTNIDAMKQTVSQELPYKVYGTHVREMNDYDWHTYSYEIHSQPILHQVTHQNITCTHHHQVLQFHEFETKIDASKIRLSQSMEILTTWVLTPIIVDQSIVTNNEQRGSPLPPRGIHYPHQCRLFEWHISWIDRSGRYFVSSLATPV
ncbi:unnamed protein product, partial [Trichobilharzia szidati]